MEYPKILYLKGWDDLSQSIIVLSKEDEDAKRTEGYKSLDEEKPKRKKAE